MGKKDRRIEELEKKVHQLLTRNLEHQFAQAAQHERDLDRLDSIRKLVATERYARLTGETARFLLLMHDTEKERADELAKRKPFVISGEASIRWLSDNETPPGNRCDLREKEPDGS